MTERVINGRAVDELPATRGLDQASAGLERLLNSWLLVLATEDLLPIGDRTTAALIMTRSRRHGNRSMTETSNRLTSSSITDEASGPQNAGLNTIATARTVVRSTP